MSATSTAPIIAQKPFAAIFVVLAFMLAVIAAVRLAGYKPPPRFLHAAPVEQPASCVLKTRPTGVVIVHDAKTGTAPENFYPR